MTKLADLCSSVDYGYTASASDDPSVGPKFLRITDIVPQLIDWTSVPHCAIEDKKREKFLVDAGDIVVARTGATVGYAKQIWARPEGTTFASYLVRFRPDPSKVDPYYLGQLVQSAAFKDWVKSVAGGAAQPNANARLLGTFDVPLPALEIQRKIGIALRAIAELIENNRRRIEILEEVARLIYHEWFVHFRFPGREDLKPVNSELGEAPDGWHVGTISDLGKVVTGSTPPTKEASLYGESAPFLTPSDMTDERFVKTARFLSNHGVQRFDRRMVPAGSVCFTCIGSIGKMAVAADRLLTNQQINAVVPSGDYSSGFIYQLLRDRAGHVVSIAGGAATPIVNKSTFEAVEVLLPEAEVLSAFDGVEQPVGRLIDLLTRQNHVLARARDLLLPRLVSGKLSVSDLDLDLEPVA